jgi:hypothetical protein
MILLKLWFSPENYRNITDTRRYDLSDSSIRIKERITNHPRSIEVFQA